MPRPQPMRPIHALINSPPPSVRTFRSLVWRFYARHGRHDLPWRKTRDPYKILVSEVMLQQTQVARVIPKYELFLQKFPTPRTLANASVHDVLSVWQGLGYNRRGVALKRAMESITREHDGKIPNDAKLLVGLPGIGPYTAAAVLAFAFNRPAVCIETNIRTVYLHHFFNDRADVRDAEIAELIEKTMDKEKPRQWFWALMDYGAYLKTSGVRLNEKRIGYKKQSKFKGSDREIRGAIVRALTQQVRATMTLTALAKATGHERSRIALQLERLQKDGLVERDKQRWGLVSR